MTMEENDKIELAMQFEITAVLVGPYTMDLSASASGSGGLELNNPTL